MSLKELAERYVKLRNQLEEAKLVVTALQEEWDKVRLQDIPNAMEEENVKTISFEGVGRISLTPDLYVFCAKEEKPILHKWMRDNDFDGIVVDYIHSSTLKAFVKERIEKGDVQLPECLKITPFTRAIVTKL